MNFGRDLSSFVMLIVNYKNMEEKYMDCKVTCFERVLHFVKPLPKEKINDGIDIINNYSFQDFLDFLVENNCCSKEAASTLYDGIVMWENLEDNYWEEDYGKLNSLYNKVGLTVDVFKEYSGLYEEMHDCLINGGIPSDDLSLDIYSLKLFANGKKYKVTLIEETDVLDEENEPEEIPVAETVYDVTFIEGGSKDSFQFTSPNKVADFIYDKTNHWMLSSGVRTECYNLKLGEPVDFEHDDIKFIIKRIV